VGGALSDTVIQNLWIEHTKCGMWLDGPFDSLHVVSTTIRNVYADGINLHRGVTNSVVEQSIFRNLGDDALAMWSETPHADVNNTFRFNTIQVPVLANGIAIYGGTDNSATDNYVADSVCEGGGLQASNRFQSVALAGNTHFARNTVQRCGAPNRYGFDHNGAVWFWAEQAEMNGKVTFEDIDILNSSFAAMTFWGGSITDMHFDKIKIDTTPYVAEVRGVNGQAFFTNTVATNVEKAGIYSCNPGMVFNQGAGCSGWNSTKCGTF